MKNIVILISGTGSNMQALVRASRRRNWAVRYGTQVAAVVSNRPQATGLVWAAGEGIATSVVDHTAFKTPGSTPDASRAAFDTALLAAVQQHQPSLVLLAGFMRILTPTFVGPLEGRLINIHPSLLPAFPGLHTHEKAIAAGCKFAGATVHRVTSQLDDGPILDQVVLPILPGDTADALAARVLTQEHILYVRAVEALLAEAL